MKSGTYLITQERHRQMKKEGKAVKRNAFSPNEQPPIYNVWNYGSCDPRFGEYYQE